MIKVIQMDMESTTKIKIKTPSYDYLDYKTSLKWNLQQSMKHYYLHRIIIKLLMYSQIASISYI